MGESLRLIVLNFYLRKEKLRPSFAGAVDEPRDPKKERRMMISDSRIVSLIYLLK